MQPKILFEDQEMMAINKPAGITVNRSDTTAKEETLQDWIEDKYPISNIQFQMSNTRGGASEGPPSSARSEQSERGHRMGVASDRTPTSEEVFYERAGIVHRLDKETSGIILVAKNPSSFTILQSEFKERIVKKVYLALVHGILTPAIGEVNVPVGRLPYNRTHFGVVAGGRESVTRYRVISNYVIASKAKQSQLKGEKLSLVELYPQTGRTHQIRVHMKYLNHPLFSDELYAGRKTARGDRKLLSRLFLHASKITFVHPTTKKEIELESPLSYDLSHFLKTLSPAE